MSEYQYIAFRAIDGPVSEKNLEFMRKQSTRAEVTAWTFDNEYHFGDFHGDAAEMLRRGYDFHFHYANYGIRTLMIRFPGGLPDPKAAEPYLDGEGLRFLKDKNGPGGILRISPYYEPGDELDDLEGLIERMLPLRAEILNGDLRPLYLARLAVATDDNHDPAEEKDAPVPAGLQKLTAAQRALAELYEISEGMVAAAAENSPALPNRGDSEGAHAAWLLRQPEERRIAWLSQLMADPKAAVRQEILLEYRKSQSAPSWPTIFIDRTVAEIGEMAEGIEQRLTRERAEEAAHARAAKSIRMAADPGATIRQVEELARQRSGYSYHKAAELLAELREALFETAQSNLAEQEARKLKEAHPTLKLLNSELRKQGFLKK